MEVESAKKLSLANEVVERLRNRARIRCEILLDGPAKEQPRLQHLPDEFSFVRINGGGFCFTDGDTFRDVVNAAILQPPLRDLAGLAGLPRQLELAMASYSTSGTGGTAGASAGEATFKVGSSSTAGSYAAADIGDFLTTNGWGQHPQLSGSSFQIRVLGSVNAISNNVCGIYVGTRDSSGNLNGKGIAALVTGTNTVQLQIHDGTTLRTKNIRAGFASSPGRWDFILTWDGAGTLSLYSATSDSGGSVPLRRPSFCGSLTQAVSGSSSASSLTLANTAFGVPDQTCTLVVSSVIVSEN